MYFTLFVYIPLELWGKFGKKEKEEWRPYLHSDRKMKSQLAYKVLPEKVNLMLLSYGSNETNSPKFNPNAVGINYEYNWLLLICQNIQMI